MKVFFSKSCETAAERVINSPAAVESAAATPPAATKAITQKGNFAISGLARTIISLSIYTSLSFLLLGGLTKSLSP